nr:transposon Ty3-I Gag-Pol polyprotein [Tanacetum cinerariifolium]
MAKRDKDKADFFTEKGVFCYWKMPFGLKNIRATYQRLIDKVFNNQIGRNLEAYIDCMVIKSAYEEDMLIDIQETFDKLWAINMKLNLKKCSFGVEEGYVLANFLAKTPSTEVEDIEVKKTETKIEESKPKYMWKLYTDGASSSNGSSVGLILGSPEGKEYPYALRFEFETTNNEAKYKALLFGLRIVEVTNQNIIKGRKRRLERNHQVWVDKLPHVLWAHTMIPKSYNRETPFSLIYGSEAIIHIEISMETIRIKEFEGRRNEKRHGEDLDILKERREITSIRKAHYKQKLEMYYNKCIRPLHSSQVHMCFDLTVQVEFQGKMETTWEGPYIVRKAYEDEAYKLETLFGSSVDRTWNGSNLRKFYM